MSEEKCVVSIPLRIAFFCVNCESIGNQSNECPACTGHQLLSLSTILNRQGEKDEVVPR
jgi:hypothetical protein